MDTNSDKVCPDCGDVHGEPETCPDCGKVHGPHGPQLHVLAFASKDELMAFLGPLLGGGEPAPPRNWN